MSSLMPGLYEKVKILDHEFRVVGDKKTPLFEMRCLLPTGDECKVNVWMSRKALPMARRALKLCGFDPDQHELEDLQRNPRLLTGCVIPQVDVEINDYGPVGSIPLRQKVDENLLAAMTKAIREVKQSDEPAVNRMKEDPTPPDDGFSDIPFLWLLTLLAVGLGGVIA